MRAASNWRLNLEAAHRPGGQKGPRTKTKFTCHQCGQNAWGKPDLDIDCRPCGIRMRSACEDPDADRIDAYVMQACNDRVPED
jgi:hypothetical protein